MEKQLIMNLHSTILKLKSIVNGDEATIKKFTFYYTQIKMPNIVHINIPR